MNEIWGIVLAAGSSTRMKKQKLLLPFKGKTIIETVIDSIVPALHTNIVVVLGANHNEISTEISKFQVKLVKNRNHLSGMLSSVICGIGSLPESSKAVLVYLGDQPQIKTDVTFKVVDAYNKSGKGIVIPVYKGKRGHPVLIDMKYRTEIMQLDPQKGLRQLMEKFRTDVHEEECGKPEILRDIDTPDDYDFETNKN
ncbi:MAG: nucleotidyltransferase family protein [Bacteroidota bacterium]